MEPEEFANVPLFEGFSDDDLRACAARFQEVKVLSDHNIAREGDDSYSFFVILEGELDVHHMFDKIATLGPGDFFGEMGVQSGEKRTAHVATRSRARLAKLMTWDYAQLIGEYPILAERVAAVIAARNASSSED